MINVMIVEDERLSRISLRMILEKRQDFIQSIIESTNGTDAYKEFVKYKPDLIFMDIRIPGMNGLEVTDKIKQSYPEIVVIIISAYDIFEYAQNAISLGVQNYILKPFIDDDVLRAFDSAYLKINKNKKNDFRNIEDLIVPDENSAVKNSFPNLEKELTNALLSCNYEKIISTFHNSIQVFSSDDDKDTVINWIVEFIFLLRLILARIGFSVNSTELKELVNKLSQTKKISELTALSNEIINKELYVFFNEIKSIGNRKHQKILNYTNEHIYDYDLSLDILAEKGSCTPQYVCRIFKESLNKTFNRYITEKRIGMAMHLLLSTDSTVLDISRKVGYSDVNYFCRIFKKKTGFRPKECRQ